MPFGLSNAGATFQRAMDMAFKGLINKIVLVYLDDITIFSKNAADHFFHLRKVFQRCRKFRVSLNPKKCIFLAHEGKLLGHIVSKEGLAIDLERVEAIRALPLPSHKKALQSFLGRINFVQRFVPDFAALVKPITEMLRKSMDFKWTAEGKESFEEIKEAISQAPTLINPDFSKDFILYAFGVIRSLKKFKHLVSNNKVQLLVSHVGVKDFLLNKDLNEKRAGWITHVMEYDIEIKITKLVRGKGLCEQLVLGKQKEVCNEEEAVLTVQDNHEPSGRQEEDNSALTPYWTQGIMHFLQIGLCPLEISKVKRRYFRLQAVPYTIIDGVLFKKDVNGVLLRCINTGQIQRVLKEFHDGPASGHFAPRVTALKIMKAGYYWPKIFSDFYAWIKRCKNCAFFTGKERLAALPLQPISVDQPFMRWGLDFIGAINPNSSQGHKWILTATDYFTRWTEAVALKEVNESSILEFYEGITTRFGVPATIISDNALAFIGSKVTEWAVKNGIYLSTSSNYYPQGNGQAESTNKNLLRIIRRTLDENQRAWHTKLKSALWADRITPKRSTGNSPFNLFYGREAILPMSLELPTLELMKKLELLEFEPMEVRYAELMELQEIKN
ncbi:hypothetical protein KI387_043862 [Taxus chinensis]|uniref:Integrase catalytic domain-containing protein n=1 Tax=Taxus chinensis TaxID=29808 RepID=A0AA38CN28_TAXCH|nr:hypothetical protein KI387_043862 [Taxus chinensis]